MVANTSIDITSATVTVPGAGAGAGTVPITSAQLGNLAQQVGAGQFSVVNPLAGPQVASTPGGAAPTPAGGPTGGPFNPGGENAPADGVPGGGPGDTINPEEAPDADNAASFTGGLGSVAAAMAAFYDLPVYNTQRPQGLSDLSYQYQTGDTFGADPMLRLEQLAAAGGFGAASDAYTKLPFGANGDFRIWGYGSYTTFENDRLRANPDGTVAEDVRQEGDAFAINLGGDFQVDPDLLVGLSLGFTRSDVDLLFNGGDYQENLLTFAPYVLKNFLDDRVNVGVTAGYGVGEAEISTAADAVADEADTSMIFTSLDVSGGDYLFGTPFSMEGSFNYTFVEKELDAFLSNDGSQNPVTIATTHDLTFGSEARYDVTGAAVTLQPFVAADLVWQLEDTINKDPIFGNVGGGFRLFGSETGLSGQVEVTSTVGRSEFSQTSYEGTLSYAFGVGHRQVTTFTPFLATAFGPETMGFETGVDLSSHNEALGASLTWSQDRSRDASIDGVTNIYRLDAEIRF